MARFTKKPVTIDAILAGEVLDGASSGRFSPKTLKDGETLMPQWIIDAFQNMTIGFELNAVLVNTHHGQARAERDAWIIRGVDGEIYPCVPDVFEATYAPGEGVPQEVPVLKLSAPSDISQEDFEKFKRAHREGTGASRMMLMDAVTPRDERQEHVMKWSIECFGQDEAMSLSQRALRLLEEAIELAQAAGVREHLAAQLVSFVYERPPGHLAQEVGGVSITLLVLCAAAGLSAEREEIREYDRILSLPASYFATRNAAKNDAGFKVTHLSVTERGYELGGVRKIENLPSETFPAGFEVEVNRDGERYKIEDQPPPKATELPAAWELVIKDYSTRYLGQHTLDNLQVVRDVLDDMTARDATGRERYGVPLTAHNGRDQLVDAYQEQLDGAVYLRAAMEEGMQVNEIYEQTLKNITQLRAFINSRSKKS